MKEVLVSILNSYLLVFPEEKERLSNLVNFLKTNNDLEIIDWNNFYGHIVAGGFIYSKNEKKFLVLFHNDLNMYLYPGGHIDGNDKNPLYSSRREILEETGLSELEQLKISENELIPIDIDVHKINYNERLNLPEHYHFEFRYLFMIDGIFDIEIDHDELSDYKWIDIEELKNDVNYGKIANKIMKLLEDKNKFQEKLGFER